MSKHFYKFGYIALIALFAFFSCATTIPMQLYTLDGGRTQYYIPESESKSGDFIFSVALTFRDDNALEYPVVINYSILAPEREIRIPIGELIVTATGDRIALSRISLLYREIKGKTGIVRISSSMTRASFIKLIESRDAGFQIEYQDGTLLNFDAPDRFKDDLQSISLYIEKNY